MKRLALAASLLVTLLSSHPTGAQEPVEDSGEVVESGAVTARVRLTYYNEAGRTYSGQQTYAGSTACSWNWPIGTRFVFRDGELVTCNDRGILGWSGWLDVFRQPWLAAKYGQYADVQVLP